MSADKFFGKTLSFLIALVWLINGLFCKILGLVPRHELIVSEILDKQLSVPLTLAIGIVEVFMAAWVLSGIHKRTCALTQITVILTMNVLEFMLVPELLLWGRMNLVFALFLCVAIYCNEFIATRNRVNEAVQ